MEYLSKLKWYLNISHIIALLILMMESIFVTIDYSQLVLSLLRCRDIRTLVIYDQTT